MSLAQKPQALCTVCVNPASKRCQGCQLAYYCGPICQMSDWPTHKPECVSQGTNYDESVVCSQLIGHVMNDREIRQRFASWVRNPPKGSVVHGVAVRCNNAVEARMALRERNCDLHCNFLTRADQYMSTPPISVTGMRPGKDYVIVIEVKQHNGPLYASNAMAVALDVDEPGQAITLVAPPSEEKK